jgi:hypothetical protein
MASEPLELGFNFDGLTFVSPLQLMPTQISLFCARRTPSASSH